MTKFDIDYVDGAYVVMMHKAFGQYGTLDEAIEAMNGIHMEDEVMMDKVLTSSDLRIGNLYRNLISQSFGIRAYIQLWHGATTILPSPEARILGLVGRIASESAEYNGMLSEVPLDVDNCIDTLKVLDRSDELKELAEGYKHCSSSTEAAMCMTKINIIMERMVKALDYNLYIHWDMLDKGIEKYVGPSMPNDESECNKEDNGE